jgi:hypothetical protein
VDHTNRVHAFIQSIVDIKKKHGTVTSKWLDLLMINLHYCTTWNFEYLNNISCFQFHLSKDQPTKKMYYLLAGDRKLFLSTENYMFIDLIHQLTRSEYHHNHKNHYCKLFPASITSKRQITRLSKIPTLNVEYLKLARKHQKQHDHN